jgi:signal transduction histidine kinase
VVAIERSQYDSAMVLLNEAEIIARAAGYNQLLIDIYKQFSRLYNTTEDYKNAAIYQDKYIQLADTLIGQELVKNIGKIQANYEERENIATIASKEILIKQQRSLNIAFFFIFLLAGLLVLVLQFGNRNIKRVNAKLSEAKEVIQKQNAELENKNRELDIEVDKKTLDLASANQSLKQVNDELDNFIYKTSHDIRGPLASLKGMCNVALLDVKDPVALDYLRKLDATAERLNSILTRLVIINQINNSKLSSETIDFKTIVNDVLMLERKKGLPPDLKIGIDIAPNTSIESDKELVRIVLENLIDNAIKFYNDSDRVDSFLDIHITQMVNGGVKVRVIDNGIGISESNPGKLFQMFSRASERSETGGIGLYITKTATEKIGGKVGLLTTPEGYTEFYVIFPTSPHMLSENLKVQSI